MTKYEFKQRETVIKMATHTAIKNGIETDTYEMSKTIDRLHRFEPALQRFADRSCSVTLSAEEERKWKKKIETVRKIIKEKIGCDSYVCTDPRGAMIRMYLVNEDGRKWHNNFDGETTCFLW